VDAVLRVDLRDIACRWGEAGGDPGDGLDEGERDLLALEAGGSRESQRGRAR